MALSPSPEGEHIPETEPAASPSEELSLDALWSVYDESHARWLSAEMLELGVRSAEMMDARGAVAAAIRAPLEQALVEQEHGVEYGVLNHWKLRAEAAEAALADARAARLTAEHNQDVLASAVDADGELDRLQARVSQMAEALNEIVRAIGTTPTGVPLLITIRNLAERALAGESGTDGGRDG
jgi:hypothetical protein